MLFGAVRFEFVEESHSFFVRNKVLLSKHGAMLAAGCWMLLDAALQQGGCKLLSEMVLCAETERQRLCSLQLEKGTVSLSQAQDGQVIALISCLCLRKSPASFALSGEQGLQAAGGCARGGQLSPCGAVKPPYVLWIAPASRLSCRQTAVCSRTCSSGAADT